MTLPESLRSEMMKARDDAQIMERSAYDAGFDCVKEIHKPSYRAGFQTGAKAAYSLGVKDGEAKERAAAAREEASEFFRRNAGKRA